MYIVDCNDKERIEELWKEFFRVLCNLDMIGVLVVVVVNKQDFFSKYLNIIMLLNWNIYNYRLCNLFFYFYVLELMNNWFIFFILYDILIEI